MWQAPYGYLWSAENCACCAKHYLKVKSCRTNPHHSKPRYITPYRKRPVYRSTVCTVLSKIVAGDILPLCAQHSHVRGFSLCCCVHHTHCARHGDCAPVRPRMYLPTFFLPRTWVGSNSKDNILVADSFIKLAVVPLTGRFRICTKTNASWIPKKIRGGFRSWLFYQVDRVVTSYLVAYGSEFWYAVRQYFWVLYHMV
jgi:hypothetical protein